MTTGIRQLGGQTVLYAMGTILTRALGFLLLPVYSNMLETTRFGDYTLIYAFLAFANVLFLFGMDAALLRFYIPEKDAGRRRIIFSACFLFLTIVSVGLGLGIIGTARWWADVIFRPADVAVYARFVRWSAVILALDAVTMAGLLLHRAHQDGGKFVTNRLITVGVNFAGNIVFVVWLRSDVEGILWANVIASAVGLLLILPVILRHLRWTVDGSVLRPMLRFGMPYIFPGLAMIAMEMLGRLQVDWYLGREAVGIFSANYRLGIFLSLIVAGFRMAWQPFFLSKADDPDAKAQFAGILTTSTALLLWGFVAVGVLASALVRMPLPGGYTFLAQEYWSGLSIVPWVLGGYVFYGWYVNLMAGIYIEKKSHWLPLVTGGGALLNFVLNLVLIPRFGIEGAAVGGCVAYAGMAALLWVLVQRFYPVPYDYGRLAVLWGAALAVFLIGYWNGPDTPIIFKTAAVVLYPVVLIGLRIVTVQEIRQVRIADLIGRRR